MAFQGSLADLPLPDIIQLVSVSGKTGVFRVERREEQGNIFLHEGQIVDAQLGPLRGEEAVYEIAIWQEGQFHFEPEATSPEVTVHKSNTNLLMEAARRIDEWKVLSKKIASTRAVPTFSDRNAAGSVSLNPKEWEVIRQIDGERSIEAIAAALGASPFDTAKILYGLLTSGLVKLEGEGALPFASRLSGVGEERLRELLAAIQLRARRDLDSGAFEELRSAYAEAQTAIGAGAGGAAVESYIRSAERAISADHGARQAQQFLSEVERLLPSK